MLHNPLLSLLPVPFCESFILALLIHIESSEVVRSPAVQLLCETMNLTRFKNNNNKRQINFWESCTVAEDQDVIRRPLANPGNNLGQQEPISEDDLLGSPIFVCVSFPLYGPPCNVI